MQNLHLVELVDLGLLLVGLIEVLDNIGDVVVLFGASGGGLRGGVLGVHGLVRFSELSERGERVGAKLVQDTGDELGELLVDTVAVHGEGVGGGKAVDCANQARASRASEKQREVRMRVESIGPSRALPSWMCEMSEGQGRTAP